MSSICFRPCFCYYKDSKQKYMCTDNTYSCFIRYLSFIVQLSQPKSLHDSLQYLLSRGTVTWRIFPSPIHCCVILKKHKLSPCIDMKLQEQKSDLSLWILLCLKCSIKYCTVPFSVLQPCLYVYIPITKTPIFQAIREN